jgi:predicted acetyltransferase
MNKAFSLKLLKDNMGKSEYEMFQEIPSSEPGAENLLNGLSFEQFKEYSRELITKETRKLDNNGTPVITYIMYVNNRPVGAISVRTKINKYWKEHSGNIFYTIRPSERKKGYGARMLRLVLEECKKMGFKKVLLQSSEGNIASAKTIESNNGKLLRENKSRFYEIDLIKTIY